VITADMGSAGDSDELGRSVKFCSFIPVRHDFAPLPFPRSFARSGPKEDALRLHAIKKSGNSRRKPLSKELWIFKNVRAVWRERSRERLSFSPHFL
jgi:hypothetical protein